MDLIAHRGFVDDGPENALPTLRRASAVADAVEFDVRLASDGEPVVFHDRTVDRLTDERGPVGDFTADELTAMSLVGTDATIPTPAAVLETLSGPIVPELKDSRVTDRVVSLLVTYADPVLVSSFDPAVLAAVSDGPGERADPADRSDWQTAVLCGPPRIQAELPDGTPSDVEEAIAVARELRAGAIHPHHSQCTRAAVEGAHDAGLRVNAWTIRSQQVAAAMDDVGVDGVIADSPDYVSR